MSETYFKPLEVAPAVEGGAQAPGQGRPGEESEEGCLEDEEGPAPPRAALAGAGGLWHSRAWEERACSQTRFLPTPRVAYGFCIHRVLSL